MWNSIVLQYFHLLLQFGILNKFQTQRLHRNVNPSQQNYLMPNRLNGGCRRLRNGFAFFETLTFKPVQTKPQTPRSSQMKRKRNRKVSKLNWCKTIGTKTMPASFPFLVASLWSLQPGCHDGNEERPKHTVTNHVNFIIWRKMFSLTSKQTVQHEPPPAM